MPYLEIPDDLWNQINMLQMQFNFSAQEDFLKFCLDTAQTRYCPAVGAIVTRDESEILLVGNDYGEDELVWNLPGGAVDPGEDLVQAAARELYEESGITTLEIGPLAWIVQVILQENLPFIVGFVFEVKAWEGQVSLENEVAHGDVQQAKFLPFADAIDCMIDGNKIALREWLADPRDVPRIYQSTPDGVKRVK
jgi:ADP-ribose pyrophosphatase YjhB (NUDIX family)